METMTIEYDNQNAVTMQEMGVLENDFENELKRAISGDELMRRITNRINKMLCITALSEIQE